MEKESKQKKASKQYLDTTSLKVSEEAAPHQKTVHATQHQRVYWEEVTSIIFPPKRIKHMKLPTCHKLDK